MATKKKSKIKTKKAIRRPAAKAVRLTVRIATGKACELTRTPRAEGGFYYDCDNKSCDGKCRFYMRDVGGGMVEVGCDCLQLF